MLPQILSQELHHVLGLVDVGDEKRSDSVARQYHYRLPINQLTWQELARQCLLLALTRLLELPGTCVQRRDFDYTPTG